MIFRSEFYFLSFFFFNDTATTEIYTLSLHDALPISLREVLTIKSDDIIGRSAAFDAIVKGQRIGQPHTPASFNVLLKHLRGLSLDVELRNSNENNE